jgi:uncharacterized membrane protein YjdF
MAWLLPPALVGFATDFDPNGWLSESDTVFEACAWFVVAGIGIVPAAMALWGQRHQLSGGSIVLLVVASLAIFLVLAAALIVGIVALDSAINPGSGVD